LTQWAIEQIVNSTSQQGIMYIENGHWLS